MQRYHPPSTQMPPPPRPPGSGPPFPPPDPSTPQPYPAYPHDPNRSNSSSPYVHPQGIPIPAPTQDTKGPPPPTDSPPASTRPTRKRKLQSPAPNPAQQPPPQQLPPPPIPGQQPQYDPYYPPPHHQPVDSHGNPVPPPGPESASAPATGPGGRQLSTSKRAEQNRKAQRAFRERRDAHVKALESRSQLLDAALASADEANRRWEECRALVDQLRVENAALRAALGAAAAHAQVPPPPPDPSQQKAQENGAPHQGSRAPSAELDAKD